MKRDKTKLLELSTETLRTISGGFPSTFGPFSATLRTGTVATQTLPGGTSPDEASFDPGGDDGGDAGGGIDV